ncbi:hypothetical protein ES703_104723 [subsurface metagenome]
MAEYDEMWVSLERRLLMVPGKDALASLNSHLQDTYAITITPTLIVDSFVVADIDPEMRELVELIDKFSQC